MISYRSMYFRVAVIFLGQFLTEWRNCIFTCLAFWIEPLSGFRFLRKISSCCWPAHNPRTHSRFSLITLKHKTFWMINIHFQRIHLISFNTKYHFYIININLTERKCAACSTWWFCTRLLRHQQHVVGQEAMVHLIVRLFAKLGLLKLNQ